MKKLGLLIALLASANSAMATEAGTHYSNVAMVVAETGASIGWATQIQDAVVSEREAQALADKTSLVNEKLERKLEQRMAEMLEDQLTQ